MKNNFKTTVGIATWKPRLPTIKHTLDSLKNQVDEIHVFLNDYNHIPDYLPQISNVFYHHENGKNYRAAAKFRFQEISKADYYFSCDDDIIYPSDYVEKSISFEQNNPNFIYTYHGKTVDSNFQKTARFQYSDFRKRNDSHRTLIAGSGVMFWNLNYVKIPFEIFDFDFKNDEIQASLWLHKNGIKIICPEKEDSWLKTCADADQINSISESNLDFENYKYILKNQMHLIEI